MQDQLLQIPVELVKAETRSVSKDTKLTFVSQETVSPELIAKFVGYTGKVGYLSFLPGAEVIQPEDVVDLPEVRRLKEEKSPSMRLRAVLFRTWEQEGKPGQFETWYASRMEQIIEHYKSKLE